MTENHVQVPKPSIKEKKSYKRKYSGRKLYPQIGDDLL